MPDISNAENRMFGPEEWHVIEAFAPAEDVVRRCLALALGDDPMFDADSLTGKPVRPARDVAGSEDALDAGFEVLIDDSAAIDLESRLFRQRDWRPDADPDDDEVGLKAFSAFNVTLCLSTVVTVVPIATTDADENRGSVAS